MTRKNKKKKKKKKRKKFFSKPLSKAIVEYRVYFSNTGTPVLYNSSWKGVELWHYPRYTFELIMRVGPESTKSYLNKCAELEKCEQLFF